MIEKLTKMLLFRYSNFKKYKFIDEHQRIIEMSKYVWMMKLGKKTSSTKIREIIDCGGYIVFKAPVADGEIFFIGKFSEFCEDMPEDTLHMPEYYSEIADDENFGYAPTQFFKLHSISPLADKHVAKLRLEKNKKRLLDVIGTTRTAVMFIENEEEINIES